MPCGMQRDVIILVRPILLLFQGLTNDEEILQLTISGVSSDSNMKSRNTDFQDELCGKYKPISMILIGRCYCKCSGRTGECWGGGGVAGQNIF